MNLVASSKIKAFFSKKISEKSEYLVRILTSSATSKVIWAFQARCISIKLRLRDVICTTKASMFLSNARIYTFSIIREAIWASWARCIGIKLRLKDVTCITKASTFLSNVAWVNSFLSMISTFLVVDRTSATM